MASFTDVQITPNNGDDTKETIYPISFKTACSPVPVSWNMYVNASLHQVTKSGFKWSVTCLKTSGNTNFNGGHGVVIGY